MAFEPGRFFDGVRYVGRVRATRSTYFVYDAHRNYLIVAPDRRDASSYYVSSVPRAYAEAVRRRFRKKTTTSVEVERRMGGPRFKSYRALLALVGLKHAKMVGRIGRSLAFRIRA